MKYIRKYNESSVDLVSQIIDEVNSIFSDSEWGSITSTCSGPGEPYTYTFNAYKSNAFKHANSNLDSVNLNNFNIGFRLDMPYGMVDDPLKSIEVIQEFLIKVKRLVKNINMSIPNIIISNVSFLEYDLVCINIYKKSK